MRTEAELNALSTEGWSCARCRDVVVRHYRESKGITLMQISDRENCPLFAIVRAYRRLVTSGKIEDILLKE